MTAASHPEPDGPERAATPASVRVAVGTMALLAAFLLFYAAVTWLGREGLAEVVDEARQDLTRAEARRYVLVSAAPYLVIGIIAGVSAWFLPRRRPWARLTGLAATIGLALLTLLTMLTVGGATVASLLVLVLSVAAVTSLLARPTAAWLADRSGTS